MNVLTEHRPGDWFPLVEETPSGTSVKVVDKKKAVICLCKHAHGNKVQSGQLIASAPAMLRELERLFEKYGEGSIGEVIAKAKGSQ